MCGPAGRDTATARAAPSALKDGMRVSLAFASFRRSPSESVRGMPPRLSPDPNDGAQTEILDALNRQGSTTP